VQIKTQKKRKAPVKRFCEKNFTEFLSDLKKWRLAFLSSPAILKGFLN